VAKLLVTGASGLLGSNLVLQAAENHQVTAVTHSFPLVSERVSVVRADMSQEDVALRVIEESGAEWVIHCAAWTTIDACESDPDGANRLNRDMAGYVARAAARTGARLIHISTDAIFDGKTGNYQEEDEPHPLSVYARSKLAGEHLVHQEYPQAMIARTNLFGWNVQPKNSLAEWFLERLESGEGCGGFTDVMYTPILVNDLADILLAMLEANLSGIYHTVGGECLSKYDFGVSLARIFQLDPGLIHPTSVEKVGLQAARGHHLCLSTEKICSALGITLPEVEEALEKFFTLRQNGFRERLKSMAGGR
jgi:dTDP-4-dehydrorhamnose reductase